MNISFLNPIFLWAIPLTGLPVLFHLLSRKKMQRLLFSETKFIKLAVQRSLQLFRLRQYLLLLLRCLIILLLTLVFARPAIHLVPASYSKEDTTIYVAMLLDNSYSVGYTESGRAKADTIKSIAGKILSKFKRKEQVSIISFSDEVKSLSSGFESDHRQWLASLEKYSLSGRKTRLQPALEESYKLLNGIHSRNKVMVIISDMAEHGWRGIEKEKINYFDPEVKIVFVEASKTQSENYAVNNVVVKPLAVNEPELVQIKINNYGTKRYSQVPVKVVVTPDNTMLNQGFIDLNTNTETEKELITNFYQAGKYSLYAQLAEDNLTLDNRYYFMVDVLPIRDIVAVDGDPGFAPVQSELYYLKTALNPKTQGGNFQVESLNVREWTRNVPPNVPLIVLANIEANEENYSDETKDFLRKYLSGGGNVIISLGDKTKPEDYNTVLKQFLPAEIRSLSDKEVVISSYNVQHPVFEIYNQNDQPEFEKIKVSKHFVLESKPDTTILFSLSDNTPLIVENVPFIGGGKVILYGSTLDRNWTNFPSKPVYLPFWQQIVNYLTNDDRLSVWYSYIGEKMRVPASERMSEFVVQTKEGKNINAVWIKENDFQGWELPKLESSGIYPVTFANNKKGYLIINPNISSGESDLTLVPKSAIKSVFPQTVFSYLTYDENLDTKFIQILYGQEMSQPVTVTVFCLLILESLLANRFFVRKKKLTTEHTDGHRKNII